MHDMFLHLVFYIFAGIVIGAALLAVTQNNPVRCVLFLVLAFLGSSALWLLVESEFLALILVLVYVGAVMTLFLFVVMMLNIDVESMKKNFVRYLPFGLILVAFLVGLMLLAIPPGTFKGGAEASTAGELAMVQNLSNTEALGMVLYVNYVFAFELAAVILLAAIIAAITLVHRKPIRSKKQDVVQQIMTNRDDRVKLISMRPEE